MCTLCEQEMVGKAHSIVCAFVLYIASLGLVRQDIPLQNWLID